MRYVDSLNLPLSKSPFFVGIKFYKQWISFHKFYNESKKNNLSECSLTRFKNKHGQFMNPNVFSLVSDRLGFFEFQFVCREAQKVTNRWGVTRLESGALKANILRRSDALSTWPALEDTCPYCVCLSNKVLFVL